MKIRAVVNLMLSRGFVGAGCEVEAEDALCESLSARGLAVVVDCFAGYSGPDVCLGSVEISSGDVPPDKPVKKRKK